MSGNEETVKRAAVLLDRADELRAEARCLLVPLYRARGWRGGRDMLAQLVRPIEQRGRAFHGFFITAHRPRPFLPEKIPPKSPRRGSRPGSGASVMGSGTSARASPLNRAAKV